MLNEIQPQKGRRMRAARSSCAIRPAGRAHTHDPRRARARTIAGRVCRREAARPGRPPRPVSGLAHAEERASAWQAVIAAVDGMDHASQDVFVAYHILGNSLFEIAERTRRPAFAIEQTLSRARRQVDRSMNVDRLEEEAAMAISRRLGLPGGQAFDLPAPTEKPRASGPRDTHDTP